MEAKWIPRNANSSYALHTRSAAFPGAGARGARYLKFNYIREIVPVAGVSRGMGVLVVHWPVPTRSVSELIAYAKANPGKLTVARHQLLPQRRTLGCRGRGAVDHECRAD
jgi:Tripartite tricarboxylate transporter family receptor